MTKIAKHRENSATSHRAVALPLSRPLAVASVPMEGIDVVVRANEAECAALAQMNELPGVLWLEAPLHVTRSGREGLKVVGAVRAEVRQTCVVTLEEFNTVLDEPVSVRFAPPENKDVFDHGRRGRAMTADEALDLEEDQPDPIVGGHIDLGALAAEFLTLGLDPHPRKPGVHFEEPAPAVPDENPFAAALKRGIAPDDD